MFLNVPQLKTQLESIWVALPAKFVSAKQNLYSTGLKTNKFQLFLRPGSQLKTLPKGLEGRKSKETVYTRCNRVERSRTGNLLIFIIIHLHL